MKFFEKVYAIASRTKPKLIVSMMLLSFSSAMVLNSQLASAAVYKKVDADGNVSFSDVPDKTAKLITVAPLPTVPAMSPELIERTLANDTNDSKNSRQVNYSLNIISPTPDQIYRRGDDAFSANVQVKPDLVNGDRLITLIDGHSAGGAVTQEMDRGQHQFEARIVNASGRILISKSVSFNVQQGSAKQQRMGMKY